MMVLFLALISSPSRYGSRDSGRSYLASPASDNSNGSGIQRHPCCPAISPPISGFRTSRILDRTSGIIFVIVPVLDPFTHISRSVVNSPGVRLFHPHGMSYAIGVGCHPGMIGKQAQIVPPEIVEHPQRCLDGNIENSAHQNKLDVKSGKQEKPESRSWILKGDFQSTFLDLMALGFSPALFVISSMQA